MLSSLEEAEAHASMIYKERARPGRTAAINSDEISALEFWRECVAGEATAGRDDPLLPDAIKSASRAFE